MEFFSPLVDAFPGLMTWQVLFGMVMGVVAGILVGAVPGLGGPMAIALLIPLSYGMEPLVALGIMAGIHNGASFGGAIPAVLLRIPGTTSALFTTFDGHPLSQNGKTGPAVHLAAFSSTFGGVLSAISLIILAPLLMHVTLAFGPSEKFWVTMLGIVSVSILLGDKPLKGIVSACIGILIGLVGLDRMNGEARYTFGQLDLLTGALLLVVLTGIYALPPAWQMAERGLRQSLPKLNFKTGRGDRLVRYRTLIPLWFKSALIGIATGILPGTGGGISSAIAYNEAKRNSKAPEEFGKGAPEGLAASEASNNADNAAAMIPALTLGVPGSGTAALMLGALLIHGLHPGPELFTATPDIAYGYMLEMLLTAALILPIGVYFSLRVFANALRLPQVLLGLLIIAVTCVGVYTVNNSMFDVYLLMGFGAMGYGMDRLDYPPAPLVLGLVLGAAAEYNLRLALLISGNDWTVLFTRPISLVIATLVLLVLFMPAIQSVMGKRRERSKRQASQGS